MTSKQIQRPEITGDRVLADRAFAKAVLPRREVGAHKWGVGGVLIVAGGPSYIGAAALTAMAAGRSGAGIVNLVVPRGMMGAIATIVPEAAFVPLPDGDLFNLGRRLMDVLTERAERCRSVVVGPGLGQDDYASTIVHRLLGLTTANRTSRLGFGAVDRETSDDVSSAIDWEIPIVIDADGLNILAEIDDWWTRIPAKRLVLTPHVGEMSRLMGVDPDDVLSDPVAVAVDTAKRFNQIVCLKAGYTIATDGDRTVISDDAPRSLATAGTGDVLAGTIGALLAQGLTALEAIGLATYVGGRAARRMEEQVGTLGLIASDLPPAIATELGDLERA